jgi:hypothetical protein
MSSGTGSGIDHLPAAVAGSSIGNARAMTSEE